MKVFLAALALVTPALAQDAPVPKMFKSMQGQSASARARSA
jgi:hypothetical protein